MYFEGTDYNDAIFGTIENDYIQGNSGEDHLFGGLGNDWIYGGYGGTDHLFGGEGNDRLYSFFDGDAYMNGGSGDDYISVMTGKSFIKINGGDGFDTAHIRFTEDHFDIVINRHKTTITHDTGTIVIRNVEGIFFEEG